MKPVLPAKQGGTTALPVVPGANTGTTGPRNCRVDLLLAYRFHPKTCKSNKYRANNDGKMPKEEIYQGKP